MGNGGGEGKRNDQEGWWADHWEFEFSMTVYESQKGRGK